MGPMGLMGLIGLIGLMGLMGLLGFIGHIGLIGLMGLMGLIELIGPIGLMGLMRPNFFDGMGVFCTSCLLSAGRKTRLGGSLAGGDCRLSRREVLCFLRHTPLVPISQPIACLPTTHCLSAHEPLLVCLQPVGCRIDACAA